MTEAMRPTRGARVARWLGHAAALGAIGGAAGAAVEAIRAGGDAVVAAAALGYAGLPLAPGVAVVVVAVRLVWRGWRVDELGVAEADGSAPRLAGWLAFVVIAAALLGWGMFAGIRTLAATTQFKPTVVALFAPPIAVAIGLGLAAISRPVAEAFGAGLARLDRRSGGRLGRTALRPRWIAIGTVAITGTAGALWWKYSVSPRVGFLDTSIFVAPAVALAAAAIAHAVRRRVPRRARVGLVVAAGAALVAGFGVAAWARASRPIAVLEVWAESTFAAEVIERVHDIQDLRGEISVTIARPRPRPGARPRDILLITLDTVRADRTPAYGGGAVMPTLARLGAGGAVFEWAFSPGNVTRRSIPTIATGVAPTRVKGRVAGWALRLDPRHILLAERFRAGGYDTAGFFCCESFWGPRHRLGINRGIDHLVIEADGDELSKITRRWLDERRAGPPGRPAFVWVHFIEAHNWTRDGGVGPSPVERRRGYDRVLARLDGFLARIADAFAGVADDDRPIIVISADHGEGLGDHNWLAHSTDLYNSQIRVPLIFNGPGIAPRRIAEPVGLADLAPTLLDLAGFVAPGMPEMDGRNLAALVRGERAADPDGGYAFAAMIADRSVAQGVRAVVVGRHKLIETSKGFELYDIVADPDELTDRARVDRPRVEAMRAVLDARGPIDQASPFTGLR